MNDDQLDDLLRDAARSYNAPPTPPREEIWARIESARRSSTAPVARHPARTRWLTTAAGIAAVLVLGIAIGRVTRPTEPVPSVRTAAASVDAGQSAPAPGQQVASATVAPSDDDIARESAAPDDSPRMTAPRRNVATSAATSPAPAGRRAERGDVAGTSQRPATSAVGEITDINGYRFAVVEHLARTEVLLTGFRSTAGGSRATPADAAQFGALSRELLQNTRLLLATHASDDPVLTRLLQDLELVLMQISQYAAEGGARHGDLDAINQSLDRRNVLPKLRSTIPAGAPAPSGT